MSLNTLSATEALVKLNDGDITAEELTQACLDHIAAVDGDIQAWAHLDAERALAQARALDAHRQSGAPVGPLHGLPVGIKDIFDTMGTPTENGTVLDVERVPFRDATVVRLLREAGAVILGKTVTTELAVLHPGKTRNPHNPAHTPGGSSSGSAAAVAANMVPLAVGTQTNGSMIRPASFCGVVGFKPGLGLVSRVGVLKASEFLDQVGVFARTVEDAALISDVLMVFDEEDPAMRHHDALNMLETALSEPPVEPMFAFVKGPVWEQADSETREAFMELKDFLGEQCDEVELPEPFNSVADLHRTVMNADLAANFASYYERGNDKLSASLLEMIEDGRRVLAADYTRAKDWRGVLNAGLHELFERYDAIITPAVAGTAPEGLDTTGSPAFCTVWTFCGTPAVSLPLMEGENGLPLGVQLVGPVGDDARLLRTANWLAQQVASEQ